MSCVAGLAAAGSSGRRRRRHRRNAAGEPAGRCSAPIYCLDRWQLLDTARWRAEGSLAQADAALSCSRCPGSLGRSDPERCTARAVPRPVRCPAGAGSLRVALALAGSILVSSPGVLGNSEHQAAPGRGEGAHLKRQVHSAGHAELQ